MIAHLQFDAFEHGFLKIERTQGLARTDVHNPSILMSRRIIKVRADNLSKLSSAVK
jgi:hypothetical protein